MKKKMEKKMKSDKRKTRKTRPSPKSAEVLSYRARHFSLDDARLAVDIAAIQNHITALFARLSHDACDKAKAVDAHLIDAYNGLVEALKAALTVEKP